jgi:hypothetical protein
VTRLLTLAALVVAAAAAAAAAWSPAARPALLGAGIAALTTFASLLGFRLTGRSAARPVQKALAVFAAVFLLRILLVSLGLVAVYRMGDSPVAFAIAFFVPYFLFAAIEGGYVHALGRQTGKTA